MSGRPCWPGWAWLLPEACCCCCCCWAVLRASAVFLGLTTPEKDEKPMADMSSSASSDIVRWAGKGGSMDGGAAAAGVLDRGQAGSWAWLTLFVSSSPCAFSLPAPTHSLNNARSLVARPPSRAPVPCAPKLEAGLLLRSAVLNAPRPLLKVDPNPLGRTRAAALASPTPTAHPPSDRP